MHLGTQKSQEDTREVAEQSRQVRGGGGAELCAVAKGEQAETSTAPAGPHPHARE